MKKIASLLCAMLAFCGFSAQADTISFTLTVDDATHVKATLPSSGTTLELVNGENTLTIEQYACVELTGVSPWALKTVHNNSADYDMYISMGTCRICPSAGSSFTVTTYDVEASRTATATITVDDASKVNLQRKDYTRVELTDGENTFKFNPETEATVSLYPTDYSKPIYEVTLNGEVVTANYNSYTLNLTDGCTVNITTIVPDKDVNVTFTYVDEASAGCVSEVKVDDVKVEDFNGTSLSVKAGQSVSVTTSSDYAIDEFKVNGTVSSIYGTYRTTVMEDTEFSFKAHPYGKIRATIIVNDPSAVKVGKGGYYVDSAELLTLNEGSNEIELVENNTLICWAAASGCYIESVDIDGTVQGASAYYASLQEGSVVTITAKQIVMDQTAVVWIDNKEAADQYFGFQGYDRNSIDVQTGYNVIPFYSGMVPMSMSWYSPNPLVGKVYVNNVLTDPMYVGSSSYQFDVKDGDVIKVFLANEPVECAVTFDVEEGVALAVVADRITEIADLSEALTVFAGTELAIANTDAECEIDVKAGETVLTAEDGVYNLTVNEAVTISASKKIKDAISEISEAAAAENTIYDLQGRRVAKAGKGIYIINGKQTLLR